MSQKWSYNGLEFKVDLQDADFAERYEEAFTAMAEEEKKVQKAGTNSEIIRGYCKLFYGLFDYIYGEGTAQKIFDGKMNSDKCDEAYDAFMTAITQDSNESAKRRAALRAKYAPRQNREQRRRKVKTT